MLAGTYYSRNRERVLATSKRWRSENIERVRRVARENYWKNRDKKVLQNSEYRIKNKDWWSDYCKQYSKTEKYKAYHREWSKRSGRAKKPMQRFHSHKHSASLRGIEFNITFDEFCSFSGSSCYYCGEMLDCIRLDRVDNNIGYSIENVVPCCKTCNYMKKAQSKADFIGRCKMIAKNH